MNPISFLSNHIYYNPAQTPADAKNAISLQTGNRLPDAGNPQAADGQKVSRQPDYDTYECQTCKSRKYKDGSDDPGVSFKTATHLDPETAPYAIRAHEGEHVSHNKVQAEKENREIVSQTVTYHTDICPECGKVYMSGGTTRTVSRASDSQDFYGGDSVQKGVYLDLIA